MTRGAAFGVLAAVALAAGCEVAPPGEPAAPLALASSQARAARRLYDGAPPVIPHQPLNITCTECHTDTGKEAPPLGFAPANPHGRTRGLGEAASCRQCHVFQQDKELFAESDFAGLVQHFTPADRLYPGAPPVIPHPVFMRENCTACHTGPAARPEIRCTHPQRANCRQCHVPVMATEPAAVSSISFESHSLPN
jgi:nitrate reductase cytochrome c-type subunit